METKKAFTFKDFLFHKVTLFVAGIVALGIVGINVLTKAAADPVVTNVAIDQNLTTLTVTLDQKIEGVDFGGLYILDNATNDTYSVLNGVILPDGSIKFDSKLLLIE